MSKKTEPEVDDAEFSREKFGLMFEPIKSGHWWSLPLSLVPAFYLFDHVQTTALAIWLACHSGYLLISYLWIIRPYRNDALSVVEMKRWFTRLSIHNFFLGSFWAALPLLVVPPLDLMILTYLFVQISGLLLGGTAILSAHVPSYLTWATPMFATTVWFASRYPGGELGVMVSFMVVVYATCVVFALHMRSISNNAVNLRVANIDLVQQLDEKRAQAEKANEDKSLFLAAASHDLRQPLQAAELFAESLSQQIDSISSNKTMQRLRESIRALSGLTNTLLDLSNLESGVAKVKPQSIELKATLDQILEEMRPLARREGLALRGRFANATIVSDRALLERCLRNLISNAIRHTDNGGVLIGTRDRGDAILIQIWDTGPGIAPSDRSTIFAPFAQLANPHRDRSKGYGLGLSVVKQTVELLDLPLTLESRQGRGSVFTLGVPKQVRAEEILPARENIVGLEGKRVLIVEDDEIVAESLEVLLMSWGCVTLRAFDYESAMDVIGDGGGVDCVISDYRLPNNHTGEDVLLAITDRITNPRPGVIVSGEKADVIEKIRQRWPVLQKPVAAMSLRASLGQLLKNNERVA